ncbi:MAG: 50S ribosomal protein L23 [Planctomycetes bacterium]|nr:50S ribosomal protein L23 [Planctomycetota bacterium]NBY00761.1 50S ribosomal protein L23 [Planctomycetota bacterium]
MNTSMHSRRTKAGGPKLDAHQIVIRPLITEKGTHQSTHKAAYPFEVNPWSTKDEIKSAIEELFNVKVARVRTANRLGKNKRFKNRIGKLSNWKKAIVTLKPDSPKIELF